ncbi:hypothetical protein [Streptomyces blattellae]
MTTTELGRALPPLARPVAPETAGLPAGGQRRGCAKRNSPC